MSKSDTLRPGLVVASHGRHVWVEMSDGQRMLCHPRSKKNPCVVGDHVQWLPSGDEGSIEAVVERSNLFYRQDDIRTKSFAANIDQILIWIATQPEFSEHQLARALIAAEAAGIHPVIVLNKRDLVEPFARAWQRLAPYRDMGYAVLDAAIKPAQENESGHVPAALSMALSGKRTLVIGPSGSGKSTLVNFLVPHAHIQTNAISTALNSGKHTTTTTTLYWLDDGRTSAIIDSPGFQEFGLHHIEPMQLAKFMPDLKMHADGCRFYNCSHLHEPGCGVRAAVQPDPYKEIGGSPDKISVSRYSIYSNLFAELSQQRY